MTPADELRALYAWRDKLEQRIAELEDAERERDDWREWARRDPKFLEWKQQRHKGENNDRERLSTRRRTHADR